MTTRTYHMPTADTAASASISLPLVSVIMPIRNEARFIAQSLGAVLAQDYPAELIEIIVVDGMSADSTRAIITQAAQAARRNVAVLDNPAGIVPVAMNIGLRAARGAIIVRVDGHCEIAPDYVRRCVMALQRTGADNVGGLQRAVSETPIGRAIALATSSPFGVGGARFHYDARPGWVDTVYLGAYRRDVFERIGGFDEELVRNQDDELNFRLTQAGGKIWLDPSIQSVYYSRPSLRKLWKQYFEYGFYKVRVMQKRGGVASWRHLVPGIFVLSLLLSGLLALLTRKPRWALAVAGPYALANGLASARTSIKDIGVFLVMPLTFLILHAAYGSGFVLGVIFWSKKYFLQFFLHKV